MRLKIPAYILFASHETKRKHQLEFIKKYLPDVQIVDPIFPNHTRVPFLEKMQILSAQRTGKALLSNEIGVLLSHRRIWQIIKKEGEDNKHYLILESDSKIHSFQTLEQNWKTVENKYDIFYWGAWTNHVSIKRSTLVSVEIPYKMGEPLINSVYGAYGYSINKRAAKYLLSQLTKIKYQVDLYKYYINPLNVRIGAITPEVIGTWQTTDSTIRYETKLNELYRIARLKIFSFKNKILAYFC